MEKERETDLDKHVEFVKTLQARISGLEGQLKEASLKEEETIFKEGEANGPSRFYEGIYAARSPNLTGVFLARPPKAYAVQIFAKS